MALDLPWEGSCGWPGSGCWVFSAWFWHVTFEATGDGICKSPLIIQPLSSCRLKITLLWMKSYFVEKWLVQDHTSEAATKMQVSSHSLARSQQLHFMMLPYQILITGLGRLSPPRAIWGLGVFLFQVNLWNFTTKTFFKKQTNTQTDSDGADLIEFVRCGCNM